MFYKKGYLKKLNKYYAQAAVVGKPVSMKQVAAQLERECTVTKADCYAVLINIGPVMANLMAQGKSVRLEGLGTFRYTAKSKSVATAEEVNSSLIQSVRVRFVPETTRPSGQGSTRAMVSDTLEWLPYSEEAKSASGGGTTGGGTTGGATGEGGSDPLA